jgi:hypothetical protein
MEDGTILTLIAAICGFAALVFITVIIVQHRRYMRTAYPKVKKSRLA